MSFAKIPIEDTECGNILEVNLNLKEVDFKIKKNKVYFDEQIFILNKVGELI